MSIFSDLGGILLSAVDRVQDTIGVVIFSFTGVISSDLVNQVIFYLMGVFVAYLFYLLTTRQERHYPYSTQ